MFIVTRYSDGMKIILNESKDALIPYLAVLLNNELNYLQTSALIDQLR